MIKCKTCIVPFSTSKLPPCTTSTVRLSSLHVSQNRQNVRSSHTDSSPLFSRAVDVAVCLSSCKFIHITHAAAKQIHTLRVTANSMFSLIAPASLADLNAPCTKSTPCLSSSLSGQTGPCAFYKESVGISRPELPPDVLPQSPHLLVQMSVPPLSL